MKALIIVVVCAIVVYIGLSFFPVFSVPYDLENKTKELAKDWLRLAAPHKTDASKKTLEKKIKEMVAKHLENHKYETHDLKIDIPGMNSVGVKLPYTVVINLFGFELTFDKNLDVIESRSQF